MHSDQPDSYDSDSDTDYAIEVRPKTACVIATIPYSNDKIQKIYSSGKTSKITRQNNNRRWERGVTCCVFLACEFHYFG